MILYEQDEFGELESLIADINTEMAELKRNPPIPVEFSSPVSAMFSGVTGVDGLNFLSSATSDDIITKILDMISSGNFDKLTSTLDKIPAIFNNMGVGSGFFEGPIGSEVIQNIQNSVKSPKF
jgi:hypothetical protein